MPEVFSSELHCTTMCISTLGCSAFQFDKATGKCGMGSKVQLQPAEPSDTLEQLCNIAINPAGKIITRK